MSFVGPHRISLAFEIVRFSAPRQTGMSLWGALRMVTCRDPQWHSLRTAWEGALFPPALRVCRANNFPDRRLHERQFLMREGRGCYAWRRRTATSRRQTCRSRGVRQVERGTRGSLQMQPLIQFQQEGASLQPWTVVVRYPPVLTFVEAREGVSLRAVPVSSERRSFLDMAAQIH